MKTLLACLMILMALTTLPGEVRATDLPQTKWVGDLPISPELDVEPGLGFAFESPTGRIVMIYLSGTMTGGEISAYYDQALPPLGWTPTGAMSWARQGERLRLEEVATAAGRLWKIMLQPE
ncbi:hypothetical protein AB8880_11555 [Alphaproteobacteria bacterium LSUCC0684]